MVVTATDERGIPIVAGSPRNATRVTFLVIISEPTTFDAGSSVAEDRLANLRTVEGSINPFTYENCLDMVLEEQTSGLVYTLSCSSTDLSTNDEERSILGNMIVANVEEWVFRDAAGTGNEASFIFTMDSDTTHPTVNITAADERGTPISDFGLSNGTRITFTFVLSESVNATVNGFDAFGHNDFLASDVWSISHNRGAPMAITEPDALPLSAFERTRLIERYVECLSTDTDLGTQATVEDCAAQCDATAGCEFFAFGQSEGPQGDKAGQCYQEHTSAARCVEGFEEDSYDFYQLVPASRCQFSVVAPGSVYEVECETTDEEDIWTIAVNASSFTDVAGNTNQESLTLNTITDFTHPVVNITCYDDSGAWIHYGESSLTAVINFTFTWTEYVTAFPHNGGIPTSEFEISTPENYTGLAQSWVNTSWCDEGELFVVIPGYVFSLLCPASNGDVVAVTVNESKFFDVAGNGNDQSEFFKMQSDTSQPNVTITAEDERGVEILSGDVTNGTQVTFTFNLSEGLRLKFNEFDIDDLELTNCPDGNFSEILPNWCANVRKSTGRCLYQLVCNSSDGNNITVEVNSSAFTEKELHVDNVTSFNYTILSDRTRPHLSITARDENDEPIDTELYTRCAAAKEACSARAASGTLIMSNVECLSDDADLGTQATVEDCAAQCDATAGCEFFTYGNAEGPQGDKAGQCYQEHTASASALVGGTADGTDGAATGDPSAAGEPTGEDGLPSGEPGSSRDSVSRVFVPCGEEGYEEDSYNFYQLVPGQAGMGIQGLVHSSAPGHQAVDMTAVGVSEACYSALYWDEQVCYGDASNSNNYNDFAFGTPCNSCDLRGEFDPSVTVECKRIADRLVERCAQYQATAVTFSFRFSEEVYGGDHHGGTSPHSWLPGTINNLTADEIIRHNCPDGSFSEVEYGLQYDLECRTSDGVFISVAVAEGVFKDVAGNWNYESLLFNMAADTVDPTVTITANKLVRLSGCVDVGFGAGIDGGSTICGNCVDNARFEDTAGAGCSEWVGSDCTVGDHWAEAGIFRDDDHAAGLAEVQANCPMACALCGVGAPLYSGDFSNGTAIQYTIEMSEVSFLSTQVLDNTAFTMAYTPASCAGIAASCAAADGASDDETAACGAVTALDNDTACGAATNCTYTAAGGGFRAAVPAVGCQAALGKDGCTKRWIDDHLEVFLSIMTGVLFFEMLMVVGTLKLSMVRPLSSPLQARSRAARHCPVTFGSLACCTCAATPQPSEACCVSLQKIDGGEGKWYSPSEPLDEGAAGADQLNQYLGDFK